MSHNEKRAEWYKEGLAALISGVAYGITNVISGSPLDVMKTKMQCMPEYQSLSAAQCAVRIMKTEGPVGFFRGIGGPIMGSSIFRSSQFASFEAFYGFVERYTFFTSAIPFTAGLQLRVVCGGIVSGTCRALIECPFEYTKVRRQVGLSWQVKDLYNGFRPTWFKGMGMMTTYFTTIDTLRRNFNAFDSKLKLFIANGSAASLAFIAIWPIEIVKNQVQSKNITEYSVAKEVYKNITKDGAIRGLFRGVGPGVGSVFIRNGCSMLVMQKVQKFITKLGFREAPKK